MALQASLQSADRLSRAWNRQFVAGRKTWLDVMNAAREAVQIETQIADAQASQLLLSWRLAITGHGLDNALNAAIHLAQAQSLSDLARTDTEAPANAGAEIPLYAPDDAIALRMAWQIDPAALGRDVSNSNETDNEAHW